MRREAGHRSRNDQERTQGGYSQGSEPRIHALLQAWLLLLLAERDNHGYELVRQLSDELPEEMVPDPGVVYRTLRRLEQDGALSSTLRSGAGGPARKVYALTPAGRSHLEEWRNTAKERMALLERFLHRLSEVTGVSE